MSAVRKPLAAGLVALSLATGALAQSDEATISLNPEAPDTIETWMAELADPATEDWQRVERRIITEWSKSGSRAMDLLLERGRDALQAEDYIAAVEHFTALTDHAPDFAEGWNGRATAFFHLDNYSMAVADIGRALSLNPDHFEALTGLGIMLEEMENPEMALKAYRMAKSLNPHRDSVQDAIDRLAPLTDGRDI